MNATTCDHCNGEHFASFGPVLPANELRRRGFLCWQCLHASPCTDTRHARCGGRNGRKGDWINTFSGKAFYPLDPRVEDVCIEDIAHALSLLCRFTGHCLRFYSVAEHSIHVSRGVEALGGSIRAQLLGLLLEVGPYSENDLGQLAPLHVEAVFMRRFTSLAERLS